MVFVLRCYYLVTCAIQNTNTKITKMAGGKKWFFNSVCVYFFCRSADDFNQIDLVYHKLVYVGVFS